MTAHELLSQLRARGVEVKTSGDDRLVIDAPRGTVNEELRAGSARVFATVARYFVGIPVLVYSFEQFMHGDHVPGVPLEPLTPAYIYGHSIWTYVAAVGYLVGGILLLIGKKTRAAATWVGLTVLFIELVVYVPIAVVERASLDKGLNFMADTLMFCGAAFLLAGAMPREK